LLFQICFSITECVSSMDQDPGFYLCINSLAFTEQDGSIVKRRLEINWQQMNVTDGLIIVLAKENQNGTVVQITPSLYTDGYYTTDIVLPYPHQTELYTSKCQFGYRAILIDENGIEMATSCLRNEPEWQWNKKDTLAEMEIGSLMLIGAHDAAAYRDYQGSGDDNWVTSSTFAQEENLLSQLLWGVRFLDIRIGYYPTTDEKFWLVHGIIKAHPLKEGIQLVQQFLQVSRDVMVWEINNFLQTWTDEAHQELHDLLISEFYPWLVVPLGIGWSTTLQDIWSRVTLPTDEGRIILTYNEAHTDPVYFFPEVVEKWGDVDEPEDLRAYLDQQVSVAQQNPDRYTPWKPNCQLTPTTEDIIGGRWSGLREMANAVNRNVTSWWTNDWSDLPATIPIHDFVLSTGMIQESIRRNLRLAESRDFSTNRENQF